MQTLDDIINLIGKKYGLPINLDDLLKGINAKKAPCQYATLMKNASNNKLNSESINSKIIEKVKNSPATFHFVQYTPERSLSSFFLEKPPRFTFVIICNWGFIYLGDENDVKLKLLQNITGSDINKDKVSITLDKNFTFKKITTGDMSAASKGVWFSNVGIEQSVKETWADKQWLGFIQALKVSISEFSNTECGDSPIFMNMNTQLNAAYTELSNTELSKLGGGRRKTKRSKRNKKCKRRTRRS
jgi:hypothetical protein